MFHRATIALALLLCVAASAFAEDCFITEDTTIGPAPQACDGGTLYIFGCTVTIDGPHNYANVIIDNGTIKPVAGKDLILTIDDSLMIQNGGKIDVPQGNYLGLTIGGDMSLFGGSILASCKPRDDATGDEGTSIAVGGDAFIDANSVINANGKGYGSASGPGAGSSRSGGTSHAYAGGAGYGGNGGVSSQVAGGPVYGSIRQPAELGSGGGWGRISGAGTAEGGSGGGKLLVIVGGTLRIDGSIAADGRNGGQKRFVSKGGGGGGSGGSIWLTVGSLTGSGTISGNGGNAGYSGGGGAGGRIAIYTTDAPIPEEWRSEARISARGGAGYQDGGAGTIYLSGPDGDELIYGNGNHDNSASNLWPPDSLGTHPDRITVRNKAKLDAGESVVTIDNDFVVDGGTLVTTGLNVGRNFAAGGGSTFGMPVNVEQSLSTGGGSVFNGAVDVGAGVQVIGEATFNAILAAEGSLFVEDGGNATLNESVEIGGSITVSPGGSLVASKPSSVEIGTDLVVQGETDKPASATFTGVLTVPGTVRVGAHGALSHLDTTADKAHRLEVTAQEFIVEADGIVSATGRGYLGGDKPNNAGYYARTDGNKQGSYYCSGGGFGGLGGQYSNHTRNPVYGDPLSPDSLGSGGGGYTGSHNDGGDGGGLLRIVTDSFVCYGKIEADGENATTGSYHAGGGSGGGIYIRTRSIQFGAASCVTANGGSGTGSYGCGGGGGRIAIYCDTVISFTDCTSADGGTGSAAGEAGTVVISRPYYVDCAGPNDPCPDDPACSDPDEDGSLEHPYDSIQKAIDAVPENSRVVVRDGTYWGAGNRDIVFIDAKPVWVMAENGHHGCIIDCAGTESDPRRAFIFTAGEGPGCIVDGFTITNGWADDGGAIFISGEGDDAASPTIINCKIVGNQATNGGGICVKGGALPSIRNNVIAGNTASGDGGGVYYAGAVGATLENNTIADNTAAANGGGLCVWRALYATNTIFWGNEAAVGPQVALRKDAAGAYPFTVNYCDVQGGKDAVSKELGCMPIWGAGNLDADPLFADPANDDYHLQSKYGRWDPAARAWVVCSSTDWCTLGACPTSPCVDAGSLLSDCCGEPQPNGDRINIGAYGNTAEASRSGWRILGDVSGDGRVNILDLITVRNLLGADVTTGDGWKGDVNGDCKVNILDLIFVRNQLGNFARPCP